MNLLIDTFNVNKLCTRDVTFRAFKRKLITGYTAVSRNIISYSTGYCIYRKSTDLRFVYRSFLFRGSIKEKKQNLLSSCFTTIRQLCFEKNIAMINKNPNGGVHKLKNHTTNPASFMVK
jgi:hypothetical protein